MTFHIQPYPYRRHLSRRMAALNGGSSREHFLNVNVRDEEDNFVLSALVPGLKADDLNIQVLERRFGPGVVQVGFTVVGMQARILAG